MEKAAELAKSIYKSIPDAHLSIGHIKFLFDDTSKLSYTATTQPDEPVQYLHSSNATMPINARVQTMPGILQSMVTDCMTDAAKLKITDESSVQRISQNWLVRSISKRPKICKPKLSFPSVASLFKQARSEKTYHYTNHLMANFILVNDGNGEYLLNLDTVVTITPYEAGYDANEGDVNGVLIKHIHEEESILYEGLDFKSLKSKLINK